MDFTFYRYSGIQLYYHEGLPTDHHAVIIDRIYMYGDKYCNKDLQFDFKTGILMLLPERSVKNVMILISNSQFQSMGQQIIYIQSRWCGINTTILIVNCVFESSGYTDDDVLPSPMVHITLSHYNTTLTVINCQFLNNQVAHVVSVATLNFKQCGILFSRSCVFSSHVTIKNFSFIKNEGILLELSSTSLESTPCANYIFYKTYLYVFKCKF